MGQICTLHLFVDDYHDIDQCFEETLLSALPLALLLVLIPSHFSGGDESKISGMIGTAGGGYRPLPSEDQDRNRMTSINMDEPIHIRKTKRKADGYGAVDIFRQLASLVALALPLVFVGVSANRGDEVRDSEWVWAANSAGFSLLSVVVLHLEVRRGMPSPVFLALLWLLKLVVGGAAVFTRARPLVEDDQAASLTDAGYFASWCWDFVAVVLFGALADKKRQSAEEVVGEGLKAPLLGNLDAEGMPAAPQASAQPKPLPEPTAPLWYNLTFSWLNDIMSTGFQRALKHEDLYRLHPHETAQVLNDKVVQNWNQELQREKPSFTRALRKAYGKTFYVACFFKFLYDSLTFVGPQLLNLLISFLDSQGKEDAQPASTGYFYTFVLFSSACVQSVVLHQYFHRSYRTGMRLKSSIITVVYQKALRIKPGQTNLGSKQDKKKTKEEEKKEEETKGEGAKEEPKEEKASTGEIVNLMSVDAQRLQDLMSYFAILGSAPYQIVVSLVFLWFQVGPSVFVGVAIMIFMVPISGMVARQVKKYQRQLMKVKDERIKVTNEVFTGMSIIKLYAWENSFKRKVDDIRGEELKLLYKYKLVNCVSRVMWTIVPVLVSLGTFTTYVLLGNELTAAKAFTSMALFNILRFPLAFFPIMISNTMEASLSIDRIQRFLLLPEIRQLPTMSDASKPAPRGASRGLSMMSTDARREISIMGGGSIMRKPAGVYISGANLAWDDGTPLLNNLDMVTKSGELTAVIGATGSGKSGLLSALIGDVWPTTGECATSGSIAYTAQVAWIRNATLRDNILFGSPYDQEWYRVVLDACALLPDLHILPAGDMTEIGDRGINLSGGQKQRVALARAVYQRADVYLMDDPLSAVDSHVAKHIFERCIKGLLATKAVVLVTHNLHCLPSANQILLLEDRKVGFRGTYAELQQTGHSFAGIVSEDNDEEESEEEDEDSVRDPTKSRMSRRSSRRTKSKKESVDRKSKDKNAAAGQLIEKEGVAVGAVSWDVYIAYARGCGGVVPFFLAFLVMVASQGASVGSNSWLSYWSDNQLDSTLGLSVYAALGVASAFFSFFGLLMFTLAGQRAAEHFHAGLLASLLRAPMSFFDTTPLGRILNRFSKDTYTIDEVLMTSFNQYFLTLTSVVATLAVIGYATPFFLVAMIIPAVLYYSTQVYYVPTSRELKRLDSVSRSPIFSHFSETLDGVSTIRAFREQAQFVWENETKLDYNLQAYYINVSSNRWLAMRLEFVGTCIVALAALFAVIAKDTISAGVGGLSVSYALGVTQALNWMVRMTSDRETNIVSVERVKEYAEVESEAPAIIEPGPHEGWPAYGAISLKNLSLRYRPGLPLVLNRVNVDIKAGEKVGIVGRTGAGKSSMLKALLRLVESCEGSIVVDGLDISSIGLDDLRSKFSIIPQDPVLFTGTVRFNLDPFGYYGDNEVWEALRRAHLADYIQTLPDTLSYQVEEGGRNFSMGERQLLCMARALLRSSTILLLDEATSAVDYETDKLIQTTIRTEFQKSTVLTIAHRVDTIVDYDRVIVLSAGKILENDSPTKLLENRNSDFFKIWDAHQRGMES